ncbi:thermonuclease family protein [Pseudomonas sp. EL_65y_Pfl2_R95]|uniref:thermonuclease family protein n=1 Tax=Pseudomonas sp. EL_65y_Pfl2_R95 TaxID=3088698 RepID=UPI0030DD3A3A
MVRHLFIALIFAPAITLAGNCKVIDVSDGDTFTCFTDEDELVSVRLAEIDAPETSQPYGDLAKQSLYRLISSEMVKLDVQDTDSDGRSVARVKRVDGVDVNAEQVRAGAAWVYPEQLKDKSLLVLEAEAKNSQRGLWALPVGKQTAPWVWRDSNQAGTASTKPAPHAPKAQTTFTQAGSPSSSGSRYNCNTLKWCGQMNCAEARYQLTQCRNPNIDGDGDGIPCERQCR